MPIFGRREQSATTDQPVSNGPVPGQRGNPEGARSPATQAEYGQTQTQPERGRHAGAQPYGEAEPRRGRGRVHYGMAGTLMILSGLLTFFVGMVGLVRGIFFSNVSNYPFYFSVRGRGITLVVIGAVAFVVGCGLLLHITVLRHLATLVAVLSAIANFMFLPFYPFWSVIILALDVLIIWELTREHRREVAYLPCLRGCRRLGEPPPKQAEGPFRSEEALGRGLRAASGSLAAAGLA